MISQEEYDSIHAHGEIPPHTCPDIDKVIRSIRDADKTASDIRKRREYPEEVDDLAAHVGYELYGLQDTLEELRKANHELRVAAEYWRDAFDDHAEVAEAAK